MSIKYSFNALSLSTPAHQQFPRPTNQTDINIRARLNTQIIDFAAKKGKCERTVDVYFNNV